MKKQEIKVENNIYLIDNDRTRVQEGLRFATSQHGIFQAAITKKESKIQAKIIQRWYVTIT